MFAGIQEILVLVIVILAIFFVPRILSKGEPRTIPELPLKIVLSKLSGRIRLALLASIIWPLLAAGYFEPWKKDLVPFLYIGFGPIIVGWSTRWVLGGFRKKKP